MGTFGPAVSPAHDGITTGSVTVVTPGGTAEVWEVPSVDTTFGATDATTGASLPNFVVQAGDASLRWQQVYAGRDAIYVMPLNDAGLIADGASALLLISVEAQLSTLTASAAALALAQSTGASVTTQLAQTDLQIQDLYARINDGGGGGGGSAGYIQYWNAATSSYEPAPGSFTFTVGPNAPTPVPGDYQGLWFETS